MLKDIDIRSITNDAFYDRGVKYYKKGAVRDATKRKEKNVSVFTARVVGASGVYKTKVRLAGDKIEDWDCTCPVADMYSAACKHVVALLKTVQRREEKEERLPRGSKKETGLCLFSLFEGEADKASVKKEERPLRLEAKLSVSYEYGNVTNWLEFRIGREKLYVLRNIPEFIRMAESGALIVLGTQLRIAPGELHFEEGVSESLWNFLSRTYRDFMSAEAYSSYFRSSYHTLSAMFEQKRFKLTPTHLREFLEIMKDVPFPLVLDAMTARTVHVEDGRPAVRIRVDETEGEGARIALMEPSAMSLLDSSGELLLVGDTVYRTDPAFAEMIVPLCEAFSRASSLQLTKEHVGDFFAKILPKLEKGAAVEVAASFAARYEMMPLAAEVRLDYYKDGVAAELSFHYGEASFNPVTENPPLEVGGRSLIRDIEAERRIRACFDGFDFVREGDRLVQEEEEPFYDFLEEGLPELSKLADVFYAESFRRKPVSKMPPVTLGVSVSDENLLEISFLNREFDFDELVRILQSYRTKRRYHRLKDGSFISLEEQALESLADFVENTGIGGAGEKAEIPLARAMYIDAFAREDGALKLERGRSFKALVRDIREPSESDAVLPPSLEGVLRDYQVTGFAWLTALSNHGLGGILADDMGLGKTLQVIAFLLSKKEEGARPSLVVAPTSLMYNWIDEANRFAPELRTAAAGGTKEERAKMLERTDVDLIVTTYNLLKRDIGMYEKKNFRYCFLDEAQHIKNPTTQSAKAVKRLKTGGYFALTGTPIENTLTELWSIFDFLMPGYLGTHKYFRTHFEIPVVRAKDKEAAENLRRHIAPFILRRLKKDVLTELPDKMESRMICEMTEKQAKVYAAHFVQAQKEFRDELKARGFDASHIKILALLTRLRQIACDPALFLDTYDGGSGKIDLLEEILEEAVAGGHRALVFSQFTAMLARIQERLKSMGLNYSYIDGSTPAITRLSLVKEFNAGSTPVFLISLKAGGTGLNLTGADMVIHCDPWWNPAVEEQATDRAYRIGQEKNVQVIKLVTRGTIEEKIFALQEKKKALIDQMIRPGESFLTKLGKEEIEELFR